MDIFKKIYPEINIREISHREITAFADTHKLLPDQIKELRVYRRKLQNRKSARDNRVRKKQFLDALQHQCSAYMKHIAALEARCRKLSEELATKEEDCNVLQTRLQIMMDITTTMPIPNTQTVEHVSYPPPHMHNNALPHQL